MTKATRLTANHAKSDDTRKTRRTRIFPVTMLAVLFSIVFIFPAAEATLGKKSGSGIKRASTPYPGARQAVSDYVQDKLALANKGFYDERRGSNEVEHARPVPIEQYHSVQFQRNSAQHAKMFPPSDFGGAARRQRQRHQPNLGGRQFPNYQPEPYSYDNRRAHLTGWRRRQGLEAVAEAEAKKHGVKTSQRRHLVAQANRRWPGREYSEEE
eukprot:Filipodium_phascolosomae@DN7515_c0_g1_i1.p1